MSNEQRPEPKLPVDYLKGLAAMDEQLKAELKIDNPAQVALDKPNPEGAINMDIIADDSVMARMIDQAIDFSFQSAPITKLHLARIEVGKCLLIPPEQRNRVAQLIHRLKKFWPERKYVQRTYKKGAFVWRLW